MYRLGDDDDIVGQGRALAILRAAVAGGKTAHSYLFEGPSGVGKATTAIALARALNCEGDPAARGACGCTPCDKIRAGTHPDVVWFDMTGKGLTERVRGLLGMLGFRPHEGRARVVIFDPAHDLAAQRGEAANVLLKTLEEPPERTHFVLLTAEPRRLPVTVRSRCQRIRFQPLDESVIADRLVREHGLASELAHAAAQAAGGSLGRAVAELADADALGRRLEQADELIAAAAKLARDPRPMFDLASQFGTDRDEAVLVLSLVWRRFHEELLEAARGQSTAHPPGALLRALSATDEATEAIRGFIAPSLALEHLMLRLAPGVAGQPSSSAKERT